MTNKPYGLEVTFKTSVKTFWYKTSEERRESELKFFKNQKVLVVTTVGKPG